MLRKRRFHALVVALTLSALGACGSSPPVRFYSLAPIDDAYVDDPADARVLGLGPLRMPEYLKRPQLVTRGEGAEILVNETTRWAEPLEAAMHRTLATNVDHLLDDVAVVGFPDTDTVGIDLRVVGRVLRFDVDRSGLAVLEVQWRFERDNGIDLGTPRRDRFEARSPGHDDTAADAAALNDTLAQFSRRIAEALRALPAD